MKLKMPAAVACLMLLSPTAAAHHAGTMFDYQNPQELTGTVRAFQFTNPHCYIQLVVQRDGRTEEWSIELAAPSHLHRLGWRRNSLSPGDRVTVSISPLRDGTKGGEIREIAHADGTPLRLAQ